MPEDGDTRAFGVYWELVSRGGVVGHGFARGLPGELPHRPGCTYNVWSLGQLGNMVTCKSLAAQAANDLSPQIETAPAAPAPKPMPIREPIWFTAMVEFRWTVRDIMFEFQVPTAIARDIQDTWPTSRQCFDIAAEALALREQIGH